MTDRQSPCHVIYQNLPRLPLRELPRQAGEMFNS